MNVSIILSLIDRMTGPARRVASTWKQTAQQVNAASKQMQSGSAGVVTAFKRAGAAAADAAAHVNRYLRSLALANKAKGPGFAGGAAAGRMMGGGSGLASWFTIPASFSAALDAAKAENKFRALVDSVTKDEMVQIRAGLEKRIMKSGENYAILMDAAANAAQIVGDATDAYNITIASSKLANIDTRGRDASFFADSLAAILGKKFKPEDLTLIGNMMANQQKLGAATAAGTLEAYKKMAPYKGLYKFQMDQALASIGVIKNLPGMAAEDDSRIGTMGEYGMRLLNSPTDTIKKRLRALNIKPSQFMTDGGFDIGKAQEIFYNMAQTQKGSKQLKELFSGANVLASKYWLSLSQVKPEDYKKYIADLYQNPRVLDESDEKRFEGLPQVWNRIKGSAWLLGRAIGDALTPALGLAGNYFSSFAEKSAVWLNEFRQSHPTITKWGGAMLGALGLIRMIGFFSPAAAALSGWLVRLPLLLLRLGAALSFGAFVGLGRLAVEFGRMGGGLLRAGLAAGVAARAFRFLRRGLFWGAALEGATFLYQEWDRIVALFKDPLKVNIIWPEMPGWLKNFFTWAGETRAANTEKRWEGDVIRARDGYMAQQWHRTKGMFGLNGAPRTADEVGPGGLQPLSLIHRPGVPTGMIDASRKAHAGSMAGEAQKASPKGITVQANGPQVTFKQAPPAVNVNTTVNVQTNADPGAIGAAVGSSAGAAVRGAMGADGN